MQLTVRLGGRSYGSEHSSTRGDYYEGLDDVSIRKWRLVVSGGGYPKPTGVLLHFSNDNEDEWHQGGRLSLPLSVARKLGAALADLCFATKWAVVFRIKEEPRRIRIRRREVTLQSVRRSFRSKGLRFGG